MDIENKRLTNIVHITFDLTLGGTQQVIKQLIDGSDQHQFLHSVLCIDGTVGEIGELLLSKGIKVITLQRGTGFDLKLISLIRNYIKKNSVDILHCHQYSPYVYGIFASLFTGVKVIFTEHGRFYPDRSSWKRKAINPVLAVFTDAITAISQATAKALVEYENFSMAKIQVIYNGIKLEQLEPTTAVNISELKGELSIPESSFVIGTIARLDPIKNHTMMINGFVKLLSTEPDAILLIIGDGPEMPKLAELSNKLGISKSVLFTGFIVNPQKYLAIMDIFVLPSFSEGTSMTLLEAMSYRTVALVTNVGGSPEIVLNGESGIVVENDSLSQYSEALLRLYESPELRQTMAENAFNRFNDNFSDIAMVNQFQSLYKNLLNHKVIK